MPFAAAMASSWVGYEWSPHVIQLNVPETAAAAEGATDAAELAAGAEDTAAEHAARRPPTPAAAPAAAVTLRNCRLLYSRIGSVIPRSLHHPEVDQSVADECRVVRSPPYAHLLPNLLQRASRSPARPMWTDGEDLARRRRDGD